MRNKQSGFGAVEIVLAVFAVVALVAIGVLVYQQHKTTGKPSGATNTTQTTNQQQSTTTPQPPADPYAGWKTYTDTGYAEASGISIKYPSDGQLDTTPSKTVAWSINNITVVDFFGDGTQTTRQVWEGICEGTDVCPADTAGKTLTDSDTTINGLGAYTATVQINGGSTYHVTVIRSNKATSPNGVPYVVFTTYDTDQAALSTFDKIMASATFPS